MQAEHALDTALEHLLLECLEGKLTPLGRMNDFEDFCKVALTDELSNFVMAAEVLQHAKILHQLVPLQNIFTVAGRLQNYHLVNVANDQSLLHVRRLLPLAKHQRAAEPRNAHHLDMAVLDV